MGSLRPWATTGKLFDERGGKLHAERSQLQSVWVNFMYQAKEEGV